MDEEKIVEMKKGILNISSLLGTLEAINLEKEVIVKTKSGDIYIPMEFVRDTIADKTRKKIKEIVETMNELI